MKKNGPAAILIAIFSLIVVLGLVASFALNTFTPPAPYPSASNTTAPTITNTPDACAQENLQATVNDFDKISREFDDAFVLAQNTPAAQLADIIAEMQRVRRNAQDFPAPICLATLKEYQLGFMNAAIEASLTLYSSFADASNKAMTQDQVNAIVAQVNQAMAQAVDYGNKYTIEMARLLGVTLTPSPTMPSETTPSPAAGTATP